MNKLKSFKTNALSQASVFIVCLLVVVSSCKENTILPPDLVPDVDNINTFQEDTFTVVTHTIYKDSLLTGGILNSVNRGADVDTFRRFIYIHGTPDTEPMGLALSHGCIRMRNADVIELFECARSGMPVMIR